MYSEWCASTRMRVLWVVCHYWVKDMCTASGMCVYTLSGVPAPGYMYCEWCASTRMRVLRVVCQYQDTCTVSGVPAPGCMYSEWPWCAGMVKDVCDSYHTLLSALFQVRYKYISFHCSIVWKSNLYCTLSYIGPVRTHVVFHCLRIVSVPMKHSILRSIYWYVDCLILRTVVWY